MSKKAIIEKLNKELPALKEKFGVKKMGLFGSFARGDFNVKSDIDILVEFYPEKIVGFFEFIDLEEYLSRLLGNKKIDLSTFKAIKKSVKKDILKETVYV